MHLHPKMQSISTQNSIQAFANELRYVESYNMLLIVNSKASGRKVQTIMMSLSKRDLVSNNMEFTVDKQREEQEPKSASLDNTAGHSSRFRYEAIYVNHLDSRRQIR